MTTPTIAQRLAAEGIADSAQDLRQLSAAERLGLFAFASSGKINATRVIKNLIWQAYTAIRAVCRELKRCARGVDQGTAEKTLRVAFFATLAARKPWGGVVGSCQRDAAREPGHDRQSIQDEKRGKNRARWSDGRTSAVEP
jgi:uncharacterized membrane protein